MKLYYSNLPALFLLAAVSTKVQAMSGQEIASKFAIHDPITGYDSGSNTFTMTYPGTSGGIDASNFRVSFYDKNCKDPEEIENGEYEQLGCTSYYNTGANIRPPNTKYENDGTGFTAETCNQACKDEGYSFFGFECPTTNEVHCQCYTAQSVGEDKPLEKANCKAEVGDDGDKHCTGPAMINGISLGGADIGSIYKVTTFAIPSQAFVLDKGINADAISIANYEITEGKQTYVFPTIDSKPKDNVQVGFMHGLCVLGATDATASSTQEGYTYTPLTSVFADGIRLWTNNGNLSVGVNGGGAELCEGGLYLQPSGVNGPKTGTDITVEATPVDSSAGVTVCAFVEKPFTYYMNNVDYDRSGNWHNLLSEHGFTESSKTFGWEDVVNQWTSYCKPLLPEATLSFKLDTEVLANIENIYTSPSADTDEGKMEFCTRMSVGYAGVDADAGFMEANFVETVFTIKYDLEGSIDLSEFNVAPKAKDTSTGSKEYAVEAALCSDPSTTFNQGSLICVDVKPNDDSAKDGIVMKSIDSFDWKRGETTTQPAITGSNVVSSNQLTSITCDANSDKCSINSVLFADFYESNGVVTGSGSATMMFKTDRRALMDGSASASGRSLQEAAAVAAATSEFDIAIPVGASDEDGVGALKTADGGASLLFFGFTSALASIIVIVVGLVSVSADLMA